MKTSNFGQPLQFLAAHRLAVVGGGCLFGAVTPEGVQVEVGGFIMDGGCLPAPGH